MGRTLTIDDTSRLAERALDAMLGIASTAPTRSIGEKIRHRSLQESAE